MRVEVSMPGTVCEPAQKPRKIVFRHQVMQCLALVVLGLLSYLVISQFFLQGVTVIGQSMAPTLAPSHRYLLNRWIYHYRAPACSEVVVIEDPVDHGYSVKRIVAKSGDSVYITGGWVYVNGQKLEEPYLPSGTHTLPITADREQLFVCGPEQYFLLGDNRTNSADSRIYGPVPRKFILGQLIF